jgi:hypothetical protein
MWRRLLEKHVRIGDWHVDIIDGAMRLAAVGAPMVGVTGITAIGAMATDDRWEQVKTNSRRIKKRIEPSPAHNRRAVLACYGPSLAGTQFQLDETTDVFTVSGAHDTLIAAGILPDYHIECDPRPHKTDNLNKPNLGTTYLIASSVHPGYLDKLSQHDVRLWHVSTAEHVMRLVDELHESPSTIISGGGSVGLRAIPLLYTMGYRDIEIHGMDSSFKTVDGTVHQWAGPHAGKPQDLCEVQCGTQTFISSPVLLTYATGFFETIQRVSDVTFRLYGDGLLQAMVKLYQQQNLPQVTAVKLENAHVSG